MCRYRYTYISNKSLYDGKTFEVVQEKDTMKYRQEKLGQPKAALTCRVRRNREGAMMDKSVARAGTSSSA